MTERMQNLVLVPGLICDEEVWAHPRTHLAEVADVTFAPADEAPTMQALAAAVLEKAPERVTRIALLDTSSRVDPPAKAAGRVAAIADCDEGRYDDLLDRFVPMLLTPEHLAGPLGSRVRTMGKRVGPKLFGDRHRAMQTRTDARELLRGSNIPVRAIVGRFDALTSVAEHQEIADLAPRGRVSIVEECGHMPPLEYPQATTALLRDWLVYD